MTLRSRPSPISENSRFQAVDLPYGGRAFAMTVLLPEEGVSVDTLAANLDAGEWEDVADGFDDRKVELFLPRFRMSYERTLNDDLEALGMVDAFDFEGGGPHKAFAGRTYLYISEVKQKSWVDVNEEGTEAAAATSGQEVSRVVLLSFAPIGPSSSSFVNASRAPSSSQSSSRALRRSDGDHHTAPFVSQANRPGIDHIQSRTLEIPYVARDQNRSA